MARTLISFVILMLSIIVLSSCNATYRAPVQPYMGTAFNQTSAPMDITFDETRLGERRGTASSKRIIGLFSFGDASIQTAARNGRMDVVDQVDYEFLNILGIYVEFTTIAIGHNPGDEGFEMETIEKRDAAE